MGFDGEKHTAWYSFMRKTISMDETANIPGLKDPFAYNPLPDDAVSLISKADRGSAEYRPWKSTGFDDSDWVFSVLVEAAASGSEASTRAEDFGTTVVGCTYDFVFLAALRSVNDMVVRGRKVCLYLRCTIHRVRLTRNISTQSMYMDSLWYSNHSSRIINTQRDSN